MRSNLTSSVFSPRSSSQAVSAEAMSPVSRRVRWRRSKSASSFTVATPAIRSSCPASTLVALCSDTSQPCSSGRSRSGDASVASHTTGAGCAAAASKSGIVSIGFDGASSRIRSTFAGGAPVWSYSITSTPQGRM